MNRVEIPADGSRRELTYKTAHMTWREVKCMDRETEGEQQEGATGEWGPGGEEG